MLAVGTLTWIGLAVGAICIVAVIILKKMGK